MMTRTTRHPLNLDRGFVMFVQKTGLSLVGALVVLLACLLGLVFAPQAGADTLTVTSNADSGPGTLREVVATANANGEPDEIGFDLPEGQRTITLTSGQISFTEAQETTVDGDGLIAVSGNDASRVFDVEPGAALTVSGLTVRDGFANVPGGTRIELVGGGIRNAGALNVSDSTFNENFSDQAGGGIYNGPGASLIVIRSTFSGNESNEGGGIFNDGGTEVSDGTARVEDSVLEGNTAVFNGGGLNNDGSLRVIDTAVTGNSADGNAGGGVAQFRLGTMTVSRSTIAGNSSEEGGGVFIDSGDATINRTTVSGNTGTQRGGGILSNTNLTDETAIVRNSTVSGNSTPQQGGGIYVINGLISVENTTITANTAPEGEGAGIATGGGTIGADTTRIEVGSSIVAANDSTDVDVGVEPISPFVSEGHNVVGDGNATDAFSQPSDQTNVSAPGLGPLADNGGPTQTHALLEGSPAIDKGNSFGLTTDQRGEERPSDFAAVANAIGGDGSDIGAFELQVPNQPPVANDDSYATGEDTPITVPASEGVLANDNDAEEDTLSATVVLEPTNGSLTLNAEGSFTYTPDTNFNGSDFFTYTVSDGNGGTDTATVRIGVTSANDAPTVAVAAGGSCGTNDRSGTINLTVSDPDDQPDDLTLAGVSSNRALVPNDNISFSDIGHNRTMTLRAADGKSGTANIEVTLSDGALKSTKIVTVRVGTNGVDSINGTTRADMLFGLDGVDALNGLGSNDLLCGGQGVDTLNATNGDDTLFGGPGKDFLRGGIGDDRLSGGGGADHFSGGAGTDTAIDFTLSQGDTKDSTIP